MVSPFAMKGTNSSLIIHIPGCRFDQIAWWYENRDLIDFGVAICEVDGFHPIALWNRIAAFDVEHGSRQHDPAPAQNRKTREADMTLDLQGLFCIGPTIHRTNVNRRSSRRPA